MKKISTLLSTTVLAVTLFAGCSQNPISVNVTPNETTASFAASQARLMMLTSRKADLEYSIQIIIQKRMILITQATYLYSNADEAYLAQIQAIDKQLDLQQKQLEIEYQIIKAEIEALKKIIDDSNSKNFKYLG